MQERLILCGTILIVACLTGCQSPESKCESMGYTPGTDQFLSCYQSISQQRHQASMLLMQQGAQNLQGPQIRTTNCNAVGATVNCTSTQ